MSHYPKYEVWGGYSNDYGEGDDPKHLEDCFTKEEAEKAAKEWASNKDMYAFVKSKD